MSRAPFALAAACGLLALFAVACPSSSTVEKKSAVDHGKALFSDPSISGTSYNQMSCATCHDLTPGESGLKKAGAPMVGVLDRPTYWGGQVDTLLGAINACLYYHMLQNDPWLGTEDDAEAIYAFLESENAGATAQEKAPVSFTIGAVSVPQTGSSANGEKLYNETCAPCHGAKTTGDGRTVKVAPILPEQTLTAHPSPTYTDADRHLIFVEKTRHGGFLGYGGQMPPVSEEVLSDQELADILVYLGVP